MNGNERRLTRERVEARSTADRPMIVEGYAAVFERRSQPMGGIIEIVSRGFFNKSKGDNWPNVVARQDHLPNMLLGRYPRTLDLNVDGKGLYYSVSLPESRRDCYDSVQRGDINSSSFSFVIFDDTWDYVDGSPQRTLLSGRLVDVGPTALPAYPDSTATVLRSLSEARNAEYDDVVNLYRNNDLRRLFVRSDMVPTPLDVVQRNTAAPKWISGEQALRIIEARKPPEQMDPHAALVELHRRKIDWDAEEMARPARQRYQPVDDLAQARQQHAEMLARAIQRRVRALEEAGHEVPDTSRGVVAESGVGAWPVRMTPRAKVANDGWSA